MGRKEERLREWKMAQKTMPKAKVRPQDAFRAFMEHRRTLNRHDTFPHSTHPYESQILLWRPEAWLFEPTDIQNVRVPHEVNSLHRWNNMMKHLWTKHTIAVDFEGHDLHSYLGMLMWCQVSTNEQVFLIHIPSCIEWFLIDFRYLLECDSVIKIFHGGQNDILYTQRDFNIFPKAVVDTQFVYNFVNRIQDKGYKIGFKEMAKTLLKSDYPVDWNVKYQLADWRIYPLPDEMKKYAHYDSFLLIKSWEQLKVNLIDFHWDDSSLNPFLKSNQMVSSLYKMKKHSSADADMTRLAVADKHRFCFQKIHQWRDNRAREVDEPPSEIMNTKEVKKISENKPKNEAELCAVFSPLSLPKWIRDVKDSLLSIIVDSCESVTITIEHDVNDKLPQDTLSVNTMEWEEETEVPSTNTHKSVQSSRIIQHHEPTLHYVRDTSALKRLPFVKKKWISNPPRGRRKFPSPGPLKLTKKTEEIQEKRQRRKLSPESNRYQRRRRQFNYRQNKKIRKAKIHLVQEQLSSPGSSLRVECAATAAL